MSRRVGLSPRTWLGRRGAVPGSMNILVYGYTTTEARYGGWSIVKLLETLGFKVTTKSISDPLPDLAPYSSIWLSCVYSHGTFTADELARLRSFVESDKKGLLILGDVDNSYDMGPINQVAGIWNNQYHSPYIIEYYPQRMSLAHDLWNVPVKVLNDPQSSSRFDVLLEIVTIQHDGGTWVVAADGYLYVSGDTSPATVAKVDLATFTVPPLPILTLNLTANENRAWAALATGGYLYVSLYGMWPGAVSKVRLSDFTEVDFLSFAAGQDAATSIVEDGSYLYVGTNTTPGNIIKISKDPFTVHSSLSLAAGEDSPFGLTVYGGKLYGLCYTSPAIVTRIDLATFTEDPPLQLAPGEDWGTTAIAASGGKLYVGLDTSPGKIVRIDLATWAEDGLVTLGEGESYVWGMTIEGGYLYASLSKSPGKVVKIDLATFTQVSTITFAAGEDYPCWLAASGGYLYVPTFTYPTRIKKIELDAFNVVDTLSLKYSKPPNYTEYFSASGASFYGGYLEVSPVGRARVLFTGIDAVWDHDALTVNHVNWTDNVKTPTFEDDFSSLAAWTVVQQPFHDLSIESGTKLRWRPIGDGGAVVRSILTHTLTEPIAGNFFFSFDLAWNEAGVGSTQYCDVALLDADDNVVAMFNIWDGSALDANHRFDWQYCDTAGGYVQTQNALAATHLFSIHRQDGRIFFCHTYGTLNLTGHNWAWNYYGDCSRAVAKIRVRFGHDGANWNAADYVEIDKVLLIS
ncbi:MAG: hypothetical protein QW587_04955 [Candidatus Bathyarchaeia archaeon]